MRPTRPKPPSRNRHKQIATPHSKKRLHKAVYPSRPVLAVAYKSHLQPAMVCKNPPAPPAMACKSRPVLNPSKSLQVLTTYSCPPAPRLTPKKPRPMLMPLCKPWEMATTRKRQEQNLCLRTSTPASTSVVCCRSCFWFGTTKALTANSLKS